MAKTKVYSEKEIACELSVSPWTIRLWRLQAGLPYFRTVGRVFYRLESVMQWMDAEERRNANFSKGNSCNIKRIAQ